jgi:hypothetical protein
VSALGSVVALLVIAVTASCEPVRSTALDLDLVWVSGDAKVRTDIVGEGRFSSQATFVLVEAGITSGEPAMVTLAGTFTDEHGANIAVLRPESLWIPGGGRRLFVLVDRERTPRPTARGAQITVSGARVATSAPVMRVVDETSFDDYGKLVLQARLINDANRVGSAVVFAAFYDANRVPMARPFTLVPIEANSTLPIRMIGPPGSRYGSMFLGDLVY